MGTPSWRRGYPVKLYGQPTFIQNEIVFEHEGRAAYPLVTLETGWGDSGNINLFVALDAEDRPIRAFMEASCC